MDNNTIEALKTIGTIIAAIIGGGFWAAKIQARSAHTIDQSSILNQIRQDQAKEIEKNNEQINARLKHLEDENEKLEKEVQRNERRLDRLTLLCTRLFRNIKKLLADARPKLPEHKLLIDEIEADGAEIEHELKEVHFPATRPPPETRVE